MRSLIRCFCASTFALAGLWLAMPVIVWADDVMLSLEVTSGERARRTEFTEIEPPPEKAHARPVFFAAPSEPVKIAWEARHDKGNTVFKDVLVHYFVVPEEKVGQLLVPRLGKAVPHEGAITLEFKLDTEVHGEFTIRLDKPGSYLLRIETQGLLDKLQHEDYAALDLVIK